MTNLAALLLDEPSVVVRPLRRLTEQDLKFKIRAARGRRLMLDEQETTMLVRLLERNDVDPFGGRVAPRSFLSNQDLSNLQLKPSQDDAEGSEEWDLPEPPTPLDSANPAGGLIPIEHAIVAPNATPHAEEAIPPSVLAAMDALRRPVAEQPISALAATPPPAPTAAPAPSTPAATAPPREAAPAPAQAKLTDAALVKAFAGIVGGGSPARVHLQEQGPASAAPGLDAADWEKTMREARAKRNGNREDEPPARRGPRIMESAESAPRGTKRSRESEEAHRRADAAARKL